jgi:excisionase family DNA binding protein
VIGDNRTFKDECLIWFQIASQLERSFMSDVKGETADERLTYSVPEAARLLGLGRNCGYDAVKRGDIPSVKIGGRILVPRAALDRLLRGA